MRHRLAFFALPLCILLTGCGGREGVTIATDLPEVMEYLEFVREIVSPPNFQVIFDSNPDRNTVLEDISPDIIISSRIAHENFSENLYRIPLSRLNKQSGSRADHFVLEDIYPESFAPYLRDNTISAFTFAFDLPIVYTQGDIVQDLGDGSVLTYGQLLESTEKYTTVRRDIYSTMGFSSLRNILFIDLLIRDHTDIRGAIPPPDELRESMKNISDYLISSTQEPQAQVYFNDIFAYSPDFSDMREGHLFSSLNSLYVHNSSLNSDAFPYVWLYSERSGASTEDAPEAAPEDGQIEALNPVYIGIVQASRDKRQSINILRQLLSARVQTHYLERVFDSKKPFKFFLFRLSSNRIVNEYSIPRFSDGHNIPENIAFPGQPLFLWDEIKTDVYYPWIVENLTVPDIYPEDLYRNLESYYRLNSRYQ